MRSRGARGFTLVEMVMTIVVLSVGLLGILAAMSYSTARSADPMLDVQARAVAAAYLEEVLLRAYADPDGNEAGEARGSYDDVDDYDALAVNGCSSTSAACPVAGDCPCDQLGAPLDGLNGYRVAVAASASSLNGAPAWQVDVVVTHARHASLRVALTGYRTQY